MDTSYSGTRRSYAYYLNSTGSWQYAGGGSLSNGISTSEWTSISGLTPGTLYRVECRITNISGMPGGVTLSERSFKTLARQRPSNFYWSPPPYSGGPFNISANQWNLFTSRINDFCAYKDLSSYSYTYVRSGDPVYYYVVNEAANQIRRMNSSAPPTVSSGQIIYASFFLNLQDSLNNIG